MLTYDLHKEKEFRAERHVEKVLGRIDDGDVTVACWEPWQISPNHAHPYAVEAYFCFEGGGMMHTAEASVPVLPGGLIVHPKGELHEYENGPERTLLYRVRYGGDPVSRIKEWRGNAEWEPRAEDLEYFGASAAT